MRRTAIFHHRIHDVLGMALAFAGTLTASAAYSAVPFGTNGGQVDFVDVIKQSSWGDTSSLDANGWPLNDNTVNLIDGRHNMPWNGPDPTAINPDISGTYRISFTGQAGSIFAFTETGDGVAIANQAYDAGSNTTTADLILSPGRFFVGLGLGDTKRRPSDAPGTGFTNLRVIRPGYSPSSAPLVTRETVRAFTPPFTSIRYLDTDGGNDYAAFCSDGTTLTQATWANRVHVTDAIQGGLPAANSGCNQAHGYAWEYMLMLANAAHHDMWINVPVDATDDYVLQLATLLRRGNSLTPGLDPSLHVYVEYSNEVWNSGFPQQQYNQAVAQQEGIAEQERYVERTIQIANIFRSAWGSSSLNNQVRVVALWQFHTELTMQAALRWAEQRFHQPVKQTLWGIGQAAYYDPTDRGSIDNLFDTLWTGSDSVRSDFIGWQAVASFFGLKQVAYESGPSISADGAWYGAGGVGGIYVNGTPTADRDSRIIRGFVHHYLDNWYAVGGDLVNFFRLRGTVSPFGDWFLDEDDVVLSRIGGPKLTAAQQVMGSSAPPISAGYVLPWTNGASSDIDPSQFVSFPFASIPAPGSGLFIAPVGTNDPAFSTYNYLLRSVASGAYTISFFGHSDGAGAQTQVYVDDALAGTVSLHQGTDAFSTPLRVTLTPGFHTLYLVGAGTANNILPAGSGLIRIQSAGAHGSAVVPSAPLNLSATALDATTISLSWAPTTMAAGYVVKRSTSSGGPYNVVTRVSSNAVVDTGLRDGRTYYYAVAATNATGESALSPQVPAVPTSAAAPAAPSGLTVVRADANPGGFFAGGEVLLRWNATPEATSYTVVRAPCMTGIDDGFCPVDTVLANVTSLTDIGRVFFPPDPQVGVTYTYTVHANNAFGSSGDSNVVTVTPSVQVPDAPASLSGSASSGAVSLSWTPPFGMLPVFDPAQYNVYRATAAAGPFTPIAHVSTANFVDRSVTAGTPYYYVVTAAKSVGESPRSNRVRVIP